MPHITVSLEKVVKSWCRLDNYYGFISKQLRKDGLDNATQTRLYIEAERIDVVRHELMQACGFEDYDTFVDFIEKQNFATWDKDYEKWLVNI